MFKGLNLPSISSIIDQLNKQSNSSQVYDSAAMQKAIKQINNVQSDMQQAVKELGQISLDKLAGKTKEEMSKLISINKDTLENARKQLDTCTAAIQSKIKAIG